MRIAITGSTGLIGTAVSQRLAAAGHQIIRVVRRPVAQGEDAIFWRPDRGEIDRSGLTGLDAVVHLAAENIASGRWTAARRKALCDSRVKGTRLLSEAIAGAANGPRILLSASAIGYYGDRGDETLDESCAPGSGFLADVCREWEAAARPAQEAGLRVVWMRFGVVLDAQGGALKKMLPIFRLGLGGCLGSGRQHVSWVSRDDAAGAVAHLLERGDLSGPFNVTAPNPVTNADFTRALARTLRRPALFSVPAFALRVALGPMADEVLLASVRAIPARLLQSGFEFRYPRIESALSVGDG